MKRSLITLLLLASVPMVTFASEEMDLRGKNNLKKRNFQEEESKAPECPSGDGVLEAVRNGKSNVSGNLEINGVIWRIEPYNFYLSVNVKGISLDKTQEFTQQNLVKGDYTVSYSTGNELGTFSLLHKLR